MLAAAESIAVAREPAVYPVRDDAYERDPEYPRDQPSARQDAQELLDRGGPLPRLAASADQLNCLRIRSRRDPGEARRDARGLRRNDLDASRAVPRAQHVRQTVAHLAHAIEDQRVRPSGAVGRRLDLAEDGEANDWICHMCWCGTGTSSSCSVAADKCSDR